MIFINDSGIAFQTIFTGMKYCFTFKNISFEYIQLHGLIDSTS